MHREMNIDFNEIIEIVYTSIRRASIFMGLGINAANNPNHTDYSLTHNTSLSLVPDNAGPEEISEFKENFKQWLIGNNLRSVTEAFDIFLLRIFEICHYADTFKSDTIPHAQYMEFVRVTKRFEYKKFNDKINILSKRFDITTNYKSCHLSIKKARDCLSHRLGCVAKSDCNENDAINIHWMAPEFIASNSTGKIQAIKAPINEPVILAGDYGLYLRYVQRNRIFKKGGFINLTPKEVSEMCLFYQTEAEGIINLAINFIKSNSDIFDNPRSKTII